MEKKFVEVANAYKVLSNTERREKYDLYGTVDDEDFKYVFPSLAYASSDHVWYYGRSFNDAFANLKPEVEDTLVNSVLLLILCGTIVAPILYSLMKPKAKRPVNRQRQVL